MQNRKFLLSMAMFMILMTGCAPYINIVKSIDENKIVVKDFDTNQERTVVFDNNERHMFYLQCLVPGDIVLVKSRNYKDSVLHTQGNKSAVYFHEDTINARLNRAKIILPEKTR